MDAIGGGAPAPTMAQRQRTERLSESGAEAARGLRRIDALEGRREQRRIAEAAGSGGAAPFSAASTFARIVLGGRAAACPGRRSPDRN